MLGDFLTGSYQGFAKTSTGFFKKDVIGAFNKFTGLRSVEYTDRGHSTTSNFNKSSANTDLGDRPKSQIQGVSKRFNQSHDPNNINTFLYVGPVSTQQEKNLQLRAKLLANDPGYVNNQMPLKQPAKSLMEKIIKA
jgi:hypothetical protein